MITNSTDLFISSSSFFPTQARRTTVVMYLRSAIKDDVHGAGIDQTSHVRLVAGLDDVDRAMEVHIDERVGGERGQIDHRGHVENRGDA